MDISSITNTSAPLIVNAVEFETVGKLSMAAVGLSSKNLWTVTPQTFNAAIQVGARTTTFFPFEFETNSFRTKDLPEPAPPVRKMLPSEKRSFFSADS